jgi:regulation of enolase protein 1 (concanavalin A-like superfamily)
MLPPPDHVHFAGLPRLSWKNPPSDWQVDGGELRITSAANTDLFHDPTVASVAANAPLLLLSAGDSWSLSANVEVGFDEEFDAGGLILWQDSNRWAKLCFEQLQPQGGTVVSVVTRDVSDQSNSEAVSTNRIGLRVTFEKATVTFAYATTEANWKTARHFTLTRRHAPNRVLAGFIVQSPKGHGCLAIFRDVLFQKESQ